MSVAGAARHLLKPTHHQGAVVCMLSHAVQTKCATRPHCRNHAQSTPCAPLEPHAFKLATGSQTPAANSTVFSLQDWIMHQGASHLYVLWRQLGNAPCHAKYCGAATHVERIFSIKMRTFTCPQQTAEASKCTSNKLTM